MAGLEGSGRLRLLAPHPHGSPRSTEEAQGMPIGATQVLVRRVLLLLAMATGALTHGYHLFQYPLYITDEGIYMEQAWSVIREGRLSPYTYFYDHAPAGWLAIAAWARILPQQFETFGNAINT